MVKFSLVIPVAPTRGAEILESIKEMDYPKKDFEVIVEKGLNPSENRNNGAEKSKGEFIIFLDDDAFIDKNYLTNVEKFLKKYPKIDIVGGPQLTPEHDGNFAKISGIALTSSFGAFKVNKRYQEGKINFEVDETVLTSANLLVKKNSFKKIGGFDLNLFPGEDPEFIQRAKKMKFKIAYNPEMKIFHKRRPNYNLFCKQFFKYGLVRPKVNKILQQHKIIFLIPMLFSIYILFLPSVFLFSKFFILPFFLYIFMTIFFSAKDSFSNKNIFSFFLLPFLYFSIHLSYGIGMIVGYITIKNLND